MAQRTVHYLLGELLTQGWGQEEKNRFLMGSLLPDGYADPAQRDTTHFITQAPGGRGVYYSFEGFRSRFGPQVQEDPLYLGYYMHLAEDCFYRVFIRNSGIAHPRTRQEVARLHLDYHLLNHWIVRHYGLENRVTVPPDLPRQPLWTLARFRPEGLLEELARDFAEAPEGEPYFISGPQLEEFVRRYLPLARQELRAAQAGRPFLRGVDFATERLI